MTNERHADVPERTDEVHPRHDLQERRESGFSRLEREGEAAMERRPVTLDEDGRAITDPGQDMRAPEEQSSVHQALLDDESLERGPDGRGAPR